jgi:CarD family transcriptional regulator
MFKVGDHVVYGTNGVCLVTDVCPSPFDKKDTRTYYVLKPVSGPAAAVIYTPVDNDRVPMRALVTAGEAAALLTALADLPPLRILTEKSRRETYRTTVAAGELVGYVSLIKAVCLRRREFHGTQRRLPDFEMEYEGIAKRHLVTELSLVLDCPVAEIADAVNRDLAPTLG